MVKKKSKLKKRENISNKSSFRNEIFIGVRYLILITLGINLSLFYKILTPLTVFVSGTILNLFYNLTISGTEIIISSSICTSIIEIIPACVAGSAYLLLLILNLSMSMEIKKRIKSLLFILLGFFVFNILRIIILSVLFVNKIKYFEELHLFLWFFLSTLFVILIWFLSVKLFKIKGTPFYSDLRYLYNKSILNSRKIK